MTVVRGVGEGRAVQRGAELRHRRGHHRRVKGAGHVELHRAQPELLGERGGARAGSPWRRRAPPAAASCRWRRSGRWHRRSPPRAPTRRRPAARACCRRRRPARTRASAARAASPAPGPRARPARPAATSAPSSPSEWPAISASTGLPIAAQPARLAQKIAGWAKFVPSSARGNGSSPTTCTASSSSSGRTRATVSRMSAVWLPWPGKRIAVGVLIRLNLRRAADAGTGRFMTSPRSGGDPIGCPATRR